MEILVEVLAGILASALGAGSITSVAASIERILSRRKSEQKLETAIDSRNAEIAAAAESSPTPLVKVAAGILETAADRQRLLLIRSEGRMGWLYWLGTVLVVLAAFVPFALVWVYSSHDFSTTFTMLTKAGVDAKTAAEASRSDWHLLVAGVSFGLLFLAAARGIISAESRHRATYFAISQRVDYYADLANVLRLADRLDADAEAKGDTRREGVRQVVKALVEGAKNSASRSVDPLGHPSTADDGLSEAIKAASTLAGKEMK